MLQFNSTIVQNTIAGNSYIALARFNGDMYPRSIKTAIKNGEFQEIKHADDSANLLKRYFSTKYRKTPEGIYVNPWLDPDDREFWQKYKKPICHYFIDEIEPTSLFWLCQDLKVLTDDQAQIIFDIIERNYPKQDINDILFFSAPGQAPILKLWGNGTTDDDGNYIITKFNVWDKDQTKYQFGNKIAKIMKGWKLPSYADDPNRGDWFVPEVKSDEQYEYEHLHGLDLDMPPQPDIEREMMRASRDISEYTWDNLGWSLARSANSHRCEGPELEFAYSLEFFELLKDAPYTPKDFFHWLNIEWGNSYYHISPDQQAIWNVVKEFDDYASNEEKQLQFNIFVNWILNWEKAIPHIVEIDGQEIKKGVWSYKSYPMYGPKSRSYKLVDGDIVGNVTIGSIESLREIEDSNEDDDLEFFELEEFDLDF